jgi:hypothetical protein
MPGWVATNFFIKETVYHADGRDNSFAKTLIVSQNKHVAGLPKLVL